MDRIQIDCARGHHSERARLRVRSNQRAWRRFVESVYEKALLLALRQKGLSAMSQYPVQVMFRGECVGDFYADIFVEGKVIVELKAVKAIAR